MSGRMPKPTRDSSSPGNEIHIDVVDDDDDNYIERRSTTPILDVNSPPLARPTAKRRDSNNDDLHQSPRPKRWAIEDEEILDEINIPPIKPFYPRANKMGIFSSKQHGLYNAYAPHLKRLVPQVPDDDDDSDEMNFEITEGKPFQEGIEFTENSSDDDDEEDMDDEDLDQSVIGSEVPFIEDEVDVIETKTTRNGGDAMLIESELQSLAFPKRDEYPEDCSTNVACGEIIFRLKGIRQFRRCPENQHFYSRYLFVRGIPYRIMILPRDTSPQSKHLPSGAIPGRHIGYFVQCNPDMKIKWNMRGHITLKMMSKQQGKDDYVRRIVHSFHPSENDWGYAQYYPCDNFDDSRNIYLEDDTVEFRVTIMVDPPKFNLWTYPTLNQKYGGHLGIKNLGSTCYFNSMMQMIFGVKKLRKLVYSYDSSSQNEIDNFMFELQSMFFRMQYSDHPVDSNNLGRLLWTDPFSQEDVHDMFMKVVDRVNDAFKAKSDMSITQMFQSRVHRIVKCLNVPFVKVLSADENICILLCVRMGNVTFNSVRESMENFVSGSRLEGDNCYNAEEFGLQAADMFSRFVTVPPVLVLTLQRSTFDAYAVKLNDRFEYASKMNMNEFLEDSVKNIANCTYILYSVVVHYGESGCGHYACYVNTNLQGKPRWVKCDDELTFRVTDVEAISNNFGVPEGSKEQDTGTAYVVTYLREDQIEDLMCEATDNDLHSNIRNKIIENFEEDYDAHMERMETMHCQNLLVASNALLREHGTQRFDLIDFKQPNDMFPRVVLSKDMLVGDIYKELRMRCDMLANAEFRVYLFRTAEIMYPNAQTRGSFKGGQRPCLLVPPEGLYQCQTLCEGYVNHAVYVRMIENSPLGPEMYQPPSDMLVFIKYYENGQYKIMGSIQVERMQAIDELKPEVREVCDLPENTPIRLYTEVSPGDVRELEDDDVATAHNGFDGDGSIMVVEKVQDNNPDILAFPHFWENLSRGVALILDKDDDLFAINTVKHIFDTHMIECYIDTPVRSIVDELVVRYPNFKRDQFLIWKVGPIFDKPSLTFYEHMNATTVADILSIRTDMYDPRDRYEFHLRYTVFSFEIKSEQPYLQQCVYVVNSDCMQTEAIFNPEWTIGQALEYCQQGINFHSKGTGKLRLVAAYRVGQDKAHAGALARAFRVLDNNFQCETVLKFVIDGTCALRIEEIPEDQLELKKDEALIPVVHFENDMSMIFGFSFFIKIREGQTFGEIKSQLKSMIIATDEEFSKFKYFLYEGVERLLNVEDSTAIKLSVWQNNDLVFLEQPVLAIQHKPTSPEQPKIPVCL
jgi:ubiquitin carboxyl-terminal hydrolase 7